MRIKLAKGTTRNVILCSNYAIKIPSNMSWKLFITGILANIQEYELGSVGFTCLTSSIFSLLGLVVIQHRVREVRHKGLFWIEYKKLLIETEIPDVHMSDVKYCNYGYSKGMVLQRLDYGS